MQIIESCYRKTSSGFFIPYELDKQLLDFVSEKIKVNSSELIGTLKALLEEYKDDSDSFENEEQSLKEESETSKDESKINFLYKLRSTFSRSSDENFSSWTTQFRSTIFHVPSLIRRTLATTTALSHVLDVDRIVGPDTTAASMASLKMDEMVHFVEMMINVLQGVEQEIDLRAHKMLLRKWIAIKNFASTKSILIKHIKEMVEGFDCFTRGYVLAYDPFCSKNDKDIWKEVLASLNPPDIIVYGQVPMCFLFLLHINKGVHSKLHMRLKF